MTDEGDHHTDSFTPDARARSSHQGLRSLITVHIPFWRPINLEELCPATASGKALQRRLDDAAAAIPTLAESALDEFVAEGRAAVDAVQDSVAQTRSRAAQLLAATGLITLLASLGASSPATAAGTAIMITFGAIAIYCLLGTMYLTVSALAVRSWEVVRLRVTPHMEARKMKELYAFDLYPVHARTRIRLSRPVGYLRDAYWFFFSTVTILVAIIILRFLPFM